MQIPYCTENAGMQHDVIHIGRPKKKECVYLGKASVGGCQRSWIDYLLVWWHRWLLHTQFTTAIDKKGSKKYTANNALGH